MVEKLPSRKRLKTKIGRLTHIQGYDMLGALQQVGVIPAAGQGQERI
ncbi:MAG: hypothetical protein ABSC04_19650 [Syntrophobacteraceae bacterium]